MSPLAEFEDVVHTQRPYLLDFLCGMCGDRFDAEDLVQETLLRAYEKRHTFRGESSARTWLTRIAINTFLSSRRRTHRDEPMPFETLLVKESPDQPERLVERRELSDCIYHTLACHVPEQYRAALILRDLDGTPYQEIAAALGCSVQAARLRVHRGRKSFREHFRKGLCFAFTREYKCVCDGVKRLGARVGERGVGEQRMARHILRSARTSDASLPPGKDRGPEPSRLSRPPGR